MSSELIYTGSGVYTPTVCDDGVVWRKDTTGNPLVGVQVDSMSSARKFAYVAPQPHQTGSKAR